MTQTVWPPTLLASQSVCDVGFSSLKPYVQHRAFSFQVSPFSRIHWTELQEFSCNLVSFLKAQSDAE